MVCNLAYGFGSWGDEMILDGVLNTLGRRSCIVHSYDPGETEAMHSVKAADLRSGLGGCDVLHVGGGGWGYPLHVKGVYDQILAAQQEGRSVVIEAAGLRPGIHWEGKAEAFQRADVFTVRDPVSQQIARDVFGRDCEIVPDPSQRMQVDPVGVGPGHWIGVNTTNVLSVAEALAPLCRALADQGYRLLGLSTIAHKRQPDLNGHRAIALLSRLAGVPILDVRGPWHDCSLGPRELAGLAQQCERIIAVRKHGAWLAARVGKPVLLVDWFNDHAIPHRLAGLPAVIPDARYCDLHAGQAPLDVAREWLN